MANISVSVLLLLEAVIIGEVYVQAWMVVDFQDPRLEISIDEEIESKNLKRLTSDIKLVRHRSDLLLDQGTIDLHCLSASLRDVRLDLFDIDSHACQSLIKGLQGALRAVVIDVDLLRIRVDVVLICLVDGVVGQVHEGFLVVGLGWRLISSRAETRKTFIVNECLNWIKPCNDYVDSKVKLDAIEKQRVIQVALHHDVLALQSVWQVPQLLEQRNTVTLRANFRFGDECNIGVIFLVFVESNHLLLVGQSEGLRDKVETLRAELRTKLHRAREYVLVR